MIRAQTAPENKKLRGAFSKNETVKKIDNLGLQKIKE